MNYAPFYPGQQVVALNTLTNDFGIGIVKDEIYTVTDCKMCKCGCWNVSVRLPVNPKGLYSCTGSCTNQMPYNAVWVRSQNFAPITSTFQAITFEKVIEEQLVSVN